MSTPDERRLAALDRYGVLEGEPPAALGALVELAARVSGAPMASLDLFTDGEQVRVAAVGLEPGRAPSETSMGLRVIGECRPVMLEDASRDERYADHPLVTGETHHVRFYAAHPVVTPRGVVIGTLSVYDEVARPVDPQLETGLRNLADRVVDVLELDLTARRLAAAQEQLAWANEALGAFAGQVSHDLKNPLAGVVMSLGLALEEMEPEHPSRDLIERAGRSADRMATMIGDLLVFAGGPVSATREPVDLGAVTGAVLAELGSALVGVEVRVGDLPTVPADPGPVRVILQNLVGNAAKFTRADVPAVIEVRGQVTDHVWRLEVADNGRGVPVRERERVLEPLVRLDRSVPGTGIGLATCARIVAAHGGRMGLSDGLPAGAERGTTAWVEVPFR